VVALITESSPLASSDVSFHSDTPQASCPQSVAFGWKRVLDFPIHREHDIAPRRLTDAARICLVLWSRLFNWREALVIVKPETLIGWHRKGFRLFWTWKSQAGRPRLPRNIRHLIAEMAAENPTWGEDGSPMS
jgi:hypothetical protein